MKKVASVEDYLAAVPEPALTTLKKIRAIIQSVVPQEATESISYGMPAFKYKGYLVGYAAFANHCSLFPGAGAMVQFQDELKGYETAKGTIRFPMNKPPPVALLKKIVKARVADNDRKKAAKTR